MTLSQKLKLKILDANIVSVGDFNDFQFTETLKIHEGDHMTNMINTVDKSDRYTYLFQGNSQVLRSYFSIQSLSRHKQKPIFFISMQISQIWLDVQVIMILY